MIASRALLTSALAVGLVACSSVASPTVSPGQQATATAPPSATSTPAGTAGVTPVPEPTCPASVADQGDEALLAPCTYFVEPVGIPVKVHFTIPGGAMGWRSWIGSFKHKIGDPYQQVGVSVINVTNLVSNGCTKHAQRNPVVGPTVDDLATALAELAPFEVKAPPTDVTIYGYSGKHLALTTPELKSTFRDGRVSFPDCEEQQLKSWIGAPLSYAFWGYTGSGGIEEFWVLDVDGRRLVVEANYRSDSPAQDIAELRSILDSIQIVPNEG